MSISALYSTLLSQYFLKHYHKTINIYSLEIGSVDIFSPMFTQTLTLLFWNFLEWFSLCTDAIGTIHQYFDPPPPPHRPTPETRTISWTQKLSFLCHSCVLFKSCACVFTE